MSDLAYQKGKIYKIVDIGYNRCYFGSTIQELSSMMAGHRRDYKRFHDGTYYRLVSFDIFDEYGLDNSKIELVESFPCNSKSELEARLGFYIKNNECINKQIAGRSKKQYQIDNKEQIAIKRKERRQQNKELVSTYNKTYREAHKEAIALKHKEYFQANKEAIALKKRAYRLKLKEAKNAVENN
jgi:hypothetical protein